MDLQEKEGKKGEKHIEKNQRQKESKTLSHLDRKSMESILQSDNTRV